MNATAIYRAVSSTSIFFIDTQMHFCGCCDEACLANGGRIYDGACVTCPGDHVMSEATCECLTLDNTCAAGETLCGDDCVDTSSDPDNCGECGMECGEICNDGICASEPVNSLVIENTEACVDGLLLCAESCIDPMTDPANCGACGIACEPEQRCGAGICLDATPAPAPTEAPAEIPTEAPEPTLVPTEPPTEAPTPPPDPVELPPGTPTEPPA